MKLRKWLTSGLIHFFLLVIMGFFLLPVIWITITSFQYQNDLMHAPPRITWTSWTLNNFIELFNAPRFIISLENTVIITFVTTLIVIVISSMGSYALSRFQFRGKRPIMLMQFSLQMGPAVAFLIPLFMLMNALNLVDTKISIIATLTVFTIPVAMFIMISFFENIPHAMEEAACIDGCGNFEIFWRIILPMAGPGLVSSALVVFIMSWGELLLALPLAINKSITLPVYATSFVGMHFVDFGGSAACAVLSALPTILLMIIFRKHFVKGLLEGAIKG
jgi:ABC-type glycerol-3-phosphate transport system permease component